MSIGLATKGIIAYGNTGQPGATENVYIVEMGVVAMEEEISLEADFSDVGVSVSVEDMSIAVDSSDDDLDAEMTDSVEVDICPRH